MNSLFYNLDCGTFVNGPGDNTPVTSFGLQYGPDALVSLECISGGALFSFPFGYNLNLAFKLPGNYQSGSYVAYASNSGAPNTGAGNYSYTFNTNIYNSGISGLIGNNPYLVLAAQLEYDYTGANLLLSPVVTATVLNSVFNPGQGGFVSGAIGSNNIQLISNAGLTYPNLDGNGSVPLSQLTNLFSLGGGLIN